MQKIKKNFGFGFMRLPMIDKEVDYEETNKLVDLFMDAGFNYFDTAHGYIAGKSEIAINKCLSSRYPRESFVLANKLTDDFFKCEEQIRPLFNKQLEICGVDYFDYYLMHCQHQRTFAYFKKHRAYEIALQLKEEGKIKHFGISFHDKAEVLDQILTEYPQIEVVQIQFNYLDYTDSAVQSKLVYEVCRKHNKPIIVMEPVKGGHLVNLPKEAEDILTSLNSGSLASFAIRFAAGFEGVMMTLSGMGSQEMVNDNISFMKDFKPLSKKELEAVNQVREIINSKHLIACTACRYCVAGCPMNISIPDLFSCMNTNEIYPYWNVDFYYELHTRNSGKAKDCIKCAKCEAACPQHLPIRDLLATISAKFDK